MIAFRVGVESGVLPMERTPRRFLARATFGLRLQSASG